VQKKDELLVVDLPAHQYQFWLRNVPKTRAELESVCSNLRGNPSLLQNQTEFNNALQNITFENEKVLSSLSTGRSILDTICSNIHLAQKSCWGYEKGCDIIYLMPECEVASGDEQRITWFEKADFGYINNLRKESIKFCSPERKLLAEDRNDVSLLECTHHFKICRGKDLYLRVKLSEENRNDLNKLLKPNDIGGWNCDLQLKQMEKHEMKSESMASWSNELKNYRKLQTAECEQVFKDLFYFVKMDSPTTMYDHMASFLSLYTSMHFNNKFSKKNTILLWDVSKRTSRYELMWKVFSNKPLADLRSLDRKKSCFRRFIFSLPPKSINDLMQADNADTRCRKSGLLNAFSKHVLHRLSMERRPIERQNRLIVTLLEGDTHNSAAITNEHDLKEALRKSGRFDLRVMQLANMTFETCLAMSTSTDILVGAHGDGLTYCLFLPDWASVVELAKDGDKKYENLVRMRGLDYYRDRAESEERNFLEKVASTLPPVKTNGTVAPKNKGIVKYRVKIEDFIRFLDEVANSTFERKKNLQKLDKVDSGETRATADKIDDQKDIEIEVSEKLSKNATVKQETVGTSSTLELSKNATAKEETVDMSSSLKLSINASAKEETVDTSLSGKLLPKVATQADMADTGPSYTTTPASSTAGYNVTSQDDSQFSTPSPSSEPTLMSNSTHHQNPTTTPTAEPSQAPRKQTRKTIFRKLGKMVNHDSQANKSSSLPNTKVVHENSTSHGTNGITKSHDEL